jgi:hypothetical protein
MHAIPFAEYAPSPSAVVRSGATSPSASNGVRIATFVATTKRRADREMNDRVSRGESVANGKAAG